MQPRISIIIPCFNQGHFIFDALNSLEECDKSLFEVIIINDGSTDEATNAIMSDLKLKGYNVIFQENKGLSSARNIGISFAKGDYILPLDADNKLRPKHLTLGLSIMESHPYIDVLYGNALYFGDKNGINEPGEFNMQRLMMANYIDACALIRKSTLLKHGLYDESMLVGWEDWELWLRLSFAGCNFYYINETLFDYRVTYNSMAKELYNNYAKPNLIENYICQKHASKMGPEWIVNHYVRRFKLNPILLVVKLIIKAYFPKYYQKLLINNKIRNGI